MAEEIKKRRSPSIPMLLTGILALTLATWVFLGTPTPSNAGVLPVGWTVVSVATVVGLLLVLNPRRHRR
ncbi:hypothetical protein [Nocardia camponoti]|uniref:Uncharacterized protein n=1 Tax=Nocardia camponoti TaxID=1616106 RepID=A0A917VAW5_9NOCA|nr:hypothetical protein [Nocardia camponoti]GGK56798.1 hypothetical protein GCM10011591_31180 [Nocardia camponoti]